MCVLNITYAKTLASGPFYFAGGVVPPKEKFPGNLHIPLASLPKNVILDITCDIENPNFEKQYPVVIEMTGALNGKVNASHLYLLNNLISKFSIRLNIDGTTPQGNPAYLTFRNHDTANAVSVKNCVAVYATS